LIDSWIERPFFLAELGSASSLRQGRSALLTTITLQFLTIRGAEEESGLGKEGGLAGRVGTDKRRHTRIDAQIGADIPFFREFPARFGQF
jgi:hypothetical protein